MSKPEISIIIVNYNSGDYLSGTIQSLIDNPPSVTWEALIIDNLSSDDSFQKARDKFDNQSGCTFYNSSKNLGFAGGNNRLIPDAKGDYILLLNPDTKVTKGAIDVLHSYLEKDEKTGASGARLIDSSNKNTVSYGWFPTVGGIITGALLPKIMQFPRSGGLGIVPDDNISEPFDVDYISGACLMTRRAMFDEIGVLDDAFFAYFEETDWCLRLKKRGYKVVFIPDAVVYHFEGKSFTGIPYKKMEIFVKSAKRFFKKHYPPYLCRLYVTANVLGSGLKIIYLTLTGWVTKSRKHRITPVLAHHKAFMRALIKS